MPRSAVSASEFTSDFPHTLCSRVFCLVSLRHTMVQPPPRHARRFGHRHFLDFRHEHRHHLQFFGTGLHSGAVLLSVRNILTVTPSDLYLLGTLALIATAAFTFFLRPLVSIAFDTEFARSQRLPVTMVEYLMMAFIALTIVACLRMVGIVLVISLLTIPQVTANIFTHSFKRMALLSIVTGYSGCLGGLYLSDHYNIPSGASIIFVSILIYLVCKGISWSIPRWKRQ